MVKINKKSVKCGVFFKPQKKDLLKIFETVLSYLNIRQDFEISVVFCDDNFIYKYNKQYRDKLQTDIDTLNKRIPTADMPDQMGAETARLNRYANIETKQSSATAENVAPKQDQSLESNLANSFTNEALKQLKAATTGDQKIDLLKQLETENMDLKDSMESMSQILAPMISNRTIDNSSQTFVTSPPKPYSSSNGYNRWQTRVDGKL
jgi:ssRNA-specific RNase YbeY (16S rRNA maturation enzyme)